MKPLFVAFLIATPTLVQAQQAQMAIQPGPYYVGQPVVARITLDGFEEQPEPTCEIAAVPAGVRADVAGVNPSVSQFIQSVNGRITRKTVVRFQISLSIRANRPGDFNIGPFKIKQGAKEITKPAIDLTFNDVPGDPNMKIKLLVADKPVYPGQRLPVTIEWWNAGEFQDLDRIDIYSPLFDAFRFEDEVARRGDNTLPVQTADGVVQLRAEVEKRSAEGKDFMVVSATRTLIADRPGTFEMEPISLSARRVKRRRGRGVFDDFGFGRSLFDELMSNGSPGESSPLRVVGEPLTLVVKRLPAQNRPTSFAGAIGDGFSIEVVADRTVVRVGDPIALDITVQGAGNINNAGLPNLSFSGLPADQFRLSEGDVTGKRDGNQKRFRTQVRVLDQSISQIPAIAYSWFNPETESFETTQSKPIALSVQEARVVSARDVVSGSKTEPPPSGDPGPDAVRQPLPAAEASRNYTLSGADLSLTLDSDVALRPGPGRGWQRMVPTLPYVIGALLLTLAVVQRRRRDIDPSLEQRRKLLKEQAVRIRRAASLAGRDSAEEIAAALRVLSSIASGDDRQQADQIIARCEGAAYSPDGADQPLAKQLVQEAAALADRIIKAAD